MSNIRFFSLLFCLVFATHFLAAQQVRQVRDFDELILSGRLEVVLVAGAVSQVEILHSDIPEDKINISHSGSALRISTLNRIAEDDRVSLRITYQTLRGVKALAGAEVRNEGDLTGDKLSLRAGSGSVMQLQVQANALDAAAGEGGLLTLLGEVKDQDINASTGGRVVARDLEAQRTYVRASTGGEATVVARAELDAAANTGGKVYYAGNPEQKYTRTTLAGEIHQY